MVEAARDGMNCFVGVGGKERRDVVMNSADRELAASPQPHYGIKEVGEYGRGFAMCCFVCVLYVCVGRVWK